MSRIFLSAGQLADWHLEGHLRLIGALGPEVVAALERAVDEVAAWAASGSAGLHHFEQTERGPTLARSERFADRHEFLGEFVRHGPFVAVLEALFGEPALLYKEKVNYKAPGGGGFAAHQDAAAYRFAPHHLSVMVPIDPATVASGCLHFARGHGQGLLPTDSRGRIADETVARLSWAPVEALPGDVVVFDSYAPHRSDTNLTDRPRRALYLTYNAASYGPLRDRYYQDKDEEFERARSTDDGARVRLSLTDDFLGRPVDGRA